MLPMPEERAVALAVSKGTTLRVQSILYNSDPGDIGKAAASLARAADFAIAAGDFRYVEMIYGDCSSEPCLSAEFLNDLRSAHPELAAIQYHYFGENLGSAGGHNRLLAAAEAEVVLILNPDVRMAPRTLLHLVAPLARPTVGMTEARQLPIEHPKEYDVKTGETSWASTACAMIPLRVLRALDGFDADNFFLYCDDVDFSWRVRLLGLKVIYEPSAMVFHDKRLSASGGWIASAAERYYSAEASLLMTWKWSRPDLTAGYLAHFEAGTDEHMQRAAAEFRKRQTAGRLPIGIDPNGTVAQFVGYNYAKHRFTL
jgi:GT2 family glycosyltransferase